MISDGFDRLLVLESMLVPRELRGYILIMHTNRAYMTSRVATVETRKYD
mgnify:CR=1 FL=1